MYLEKSVCHGISSFRNLCYPSELETNLTQLKNDIETDTINNVIEKYNNNIGDYLFVVL